ncbi:GroES-like protein [Dichomitus squalens]|nr:GroES-like protein [Dichomitus squalens]
MSTQRALVVPAEGQPFKFVSDWPIPKPGPKDVLVKLVSIALNPADWRLELGGSGIFKDYPIAGGLDGSGAIEEVGSEVTHLAKGDKVLFEGWFVPGRGTFQEYALSPAAYVAKIPDNISFDRAATVPMCLATVFSSTWAHEDGARSARLTPPWEEGGKTKYAGDVAFIVGGSSSVGQYGRTPARVRTFAAGKPITYVYDAIGERDGQRLSYELLADGGAFVTVQPFFHEYLEDLVTESKPVIRALGSFELPGHGKLGLEVYSRLSEWLATGVIVVCLPAYSSF